jgi:MinD-like ATPase involved in chromosome partitioning or flagellar assembly
MDACVGRAVVQQVPFTVMAPRSPASRCLEALTDRLLGTGGPARAAAKTFWQKVSTGPWRLT